MSYPCELKNQFSKLNEYIKGGCALIHRIFKFEIRAEADTLDNCIAKPVNTSVMVRILGFILVSVVAVLGSVSAFYFRNESNKNALLLMRSESAAMEMKVNAQLERERQYELTVHLTEENKELKERLKACK